MRRLLRSAVGIALLAGCAPAGPPSTPEPAPEGEVSVGYGTQRRGDGTGAVTSISPTAADARVHRVEELLEGRVAGLEVLRLPGGDYTLRIRGQRGIMGGATDHEPLLVVDGVQVVQGGVGSALAGLNPRDIGRIDVLKDAAATAIYGSRAAGGVIIITTKRATRP